jgi:hypothetical protein
MSPLHTFIYPEGPSAVRILIKLPQKFCSFLLCLNILHQGWKTVSSLNCRDLNLGDFKSVSLGLGRQRIRLFCTKCNFLFSYRGSNREYAETLWSLLGTRASVCIVTALKAIMKYCGANILGVFRICNIILYLNILLHLHIFKNAQYIQSSVQLFSRLFLLLTTCFGLKRQS